MSNTNQQQIPLMAMSSSSSTTTTISHQQNTQLASLEYNHQTFQEWLDLLVDSNSTEEIKNKTITELGLHLEVIALIFLVLIIINNLFCIYD
jgi:hypothetical protein